MSEFTYTPLLPVGEETTEFIKITDKFVDSFSMNGDIFLKIDPEGLSFLAQRAFEDVSHLLRPSHLQQLRNILDDKEASDNDHFVALELLKNAVIASDKVLPMCQDTGTAIISAVKGERVISGGSDAESLSKGIFNTYRSSNLRYSQLAPITMFEEKNTGNNLPAQIDIYSGSGNEYKFTFIQKGGGSANKSFLYQQTKAILNPDSLREFLTDTIINLGTAACPPYHLAIVIGGTSAESTLKTVKAASVRDLDALPTTGDISGHGWRDLEWEKIVLEMTRKMGIGAQFGGKYFCHDVRVIRLPRHGASCPIGIGVSCSADRQIRAKINSEGLFIEKLETDPARFLPTIKENLTTAVVAIDLQKPMPKILEALSQHPIKTRVNLTGTMIVARDIAHAKLLEVLETKGTLPEYVKNHPIYYAGPAKTPAGMASGSFGPTTAGRMDTYVDRFQAAGGSMIMLAKGNRSGSVREACAKYGGFYLGSIGGAAAKLALESIKHIEILEYSELGMEAIWKIEVENFPAFIVIDDKGNDFYNRRI